MFLNEESDNAKKLNTTPLLRGGMDHSTEFPCRDRRVHLDQRVDEVGEVGSGRAD